MLLQVGFGYGVKCSRSLLSGFPPSVLQGLSLGEDGGVVQLMMISEAEKWNPKIDSVISANGDG